MEDVPLSLRRGPRGELLAQGAEARVFATMLGGRPAVVKERFVKAYRHPDIDIRLRSSRIAQEARMLLRARQAGVCAPTVLFADVNACALYLERIDGPTAKCFVQEHSPAEVRALGAAIGEGIALLHDAGIVHGDLTTSNMVFQIRAHAPCDESAHANRLRRHAPRTTTTDRTPYIP